MLVEVQRAPDMRCYNHRKQLVISNGPRKGNVSYLPVYNVHFFPTEKAQKIEMRIIHGILCDGLASLTSK